jgi:hypothetical protein
LKLRNEGFRCGIRTDCDFYRPRNFFRKLLNHQHHFVRNIFVRFGEETALVCKVGILQIWHL